MMAYRKGDHRRLLGLSLAGWALMAAGAPLARAARPAGRSGVQHPGGHA